MKVPIDSNAAPAEHCSAVQSVFREHYTDAEKRQVLHRQFLPSYLQRTIKKCRRTPVIGATHSCSSSSSSTDGPPHVATKMTCKEMLLAADSPNNGRTMHDYCNNYYKTLDQNIRKTCRVDIERNYELDYKCVQKLNKLLQMQREKRQQALERRQEAERQRVLKMKMLEEQNLKEQIIEIKRQQEEKKAKRQRNENSKRKENKLEMRLQKRKEQQTTKMQQRTFTLDGRSIMEDTIQRSRLECGIEYLSNSAAFVKARKQLPISSVNNQPKEVPQEKEKEDKEKENEEKLQRNLLRTPSPERLSNASVTPKSATKPVKVRIKRIWQKNRIANELRVFAKEQAQEQEIESANQLAETNLEMQRRRKLVLTAKNKIRAQLLEKDVLPIYEQRESDEHEEYDKIDSGESINKPTNLESEATPTSEKHSKEQALERTEFKELETPRFIETAAAASGLAMLANTAATAAIAVTRKPLTADITPSTSAAATARKVAQSQQNHEDNDECVPPTQKLPNCCRISELAAAAGAAINHALANKSNITLINFEATPTVPAYLFNGESRDVPTPTPLLALPTASAAAPTQELPIAETAPALASVDSTLNPAERATRSSSASANAAATATVNTTLSTSDHEVSSTQETLCEALQLRCTNPSNALMFQTSSPNGNLSARRISLSTDSETLSAALVGAAVQNNQVDTTHHLPESTTTSSNSSRSMRRRMRKLSTYDETSTAAGKEHNKQRHQPVHKRRKTICADASFRVQPLAEPSVNTTEGHASSPSTTTVAVEKPTTRKRGRPAAAGTTTSPKRRDVAKRSGSNNTSSPLLKLVDDNTDTGTIKCSSPGVSSKLMEKQIKHTYSLNNIVKNVFVPPEIEEYLENENDAKSSTLPPTAARNVRDNTSMLATATSSSKAGTSSSSSKSNTSITKDKESIIKTVRGAKMKMIQKKQRDVMKAGDSLAEEQQQRQQKKVKTIKNAASGRSRR